MTGSGVHLLAVILDAMSAPFPMLPAQKHYHGQTVYAVPEQRLQAGVSSKSTLDGGHMRAYARRPACNYNL